MDSFDRVDALKKYIDKNLPKDKRELPIVLVGTMIDLPGRQVDVEMVATWASKERVKFFEVSSQGMLFILGLNGIKNVYFKTEDHSQKSYITWSEGTFIL